jgi:TonB-linked SusC/RagA family outer membrane protein
MLYCYFKKCFAGIIVLTLLCNTSYAAVRDTVYKAVSPKGLVTGVVVDENNRPVKGANVAVKGKSISVQTDVSGTFNISAATGDVLVFTYANHYITEVKVASSNDNLKVRLLDTYLQKRDQEDVLYGTANTDAELGSIATIYTNQITSTPATIYEYALPGQMAGLYTQQSSGFTNPSNSNPLVSFLGSAPIVVSGHGYVPSDNTEIGITVRGNNQEGGVTTIVDGVQQNLSSIDPESIESISILKDALSTILLGINSSKPVLLVTTKKAQAGTPRISFTTQTALQQSLGMPSDQLSAYQWAYLYNEALDNMGKPELYTTADLEAYKNHTDPYGHPDVNWKNLLLKEYSPLTSDRLNVNGGTEVAKYTISMDYLDQGGIFKQAPDVGYNSNLNLSRYTLNSNVGVRVNKNLDVNLQLFGQVEEITSPGASYSAILTGIAYTPNNAYPVYNPNGTFGGSSAGGNVVNLTNNLLAMSEYSGYQLTKIHNILVNMDLDYKLDGFTQGLSLKVKANLSSQSQVLIDRSYQNNSFSYLKTDSVITYNSIGSPTSIANSFAPTVTATTSFEQASLDYNRQFGKNNITAQALFDSRSQILTYDLAAVTIDRALKGAYNYDGKYYAEGVVNYSGFNRFAPGHQNGWFYAAGLGWQMGKEDFIKDNLDWINSWKWRATYGQTGNDGDAGYYTFKQTYTTSNAPSYYFGLNHPGSISSDGYTESPLANPNETWESAHKIDIGTDISFLKNRLTLTADYYHELYYDLSVPTGASIALLGSAYPNLNIGRRLYTGEELTLTYQDHVGNFNYFISGNGSIAASKVLYFDEEKQMYPWMQQTGLPETAIFGYVAQGFVTTQDLKNGPVAAPAGYTAQPGDIKYADLNGDGVINQYDEKAIGGLKPLVYYGSTIGFNYKGFSFSAIFQGVFNREISTDNAYTNGFTGLTFGLAAPWGQGYDNLLNRWTPETANSAQYPRLYFDNPNNQLPSTFYLKSGDYFRMKNAEIGYTLPASFSNKLKLSGLKVFISAENIFTIAAYREFPGMDPEVNGVGAYPIQRVLNAGLTIKL